MWASTMMRGPCVPCVAMIEPMPSKVRDDGERLHLIDHHLADRLLEAGRAGRVGELAQQIDRAILGRERSGRRGEQYESEG